MKFILNSSVRATIGENLILVGMTLLFSFCCMAQERLDDTFQELVSPDSNYRFSFYQKKDDTGRLQMYYTINYKNSEIIQESKLGVLIENQLAESALAIENDTAQIWSENLRFKGIERSNEDKVWKPVYGEQNKIRDHYNSLTVTLVKYDEMLKELEEGHSGTNYNRNRSYTMQLEVRAYKEGIAFRYRFLETANGLFLHITGEQTNYNLPDGTMAWYERWAQGPYQFLPLKNWPDESERPLTLELKNGLTVLLTEAQLVDYARTKFALNKDISNTIESSLYGNVDVITPYETPWRVVMAAEKPTDLIQNNSLILNLNKENQLKDVSWIKPGKAFRSGLTTKEALKAIDFAGERNIDYVHLDAGWYGPEMKIESDATTVGLNRDLNMREIIDYGEKKNIGIFVYVNQRALAKQNLDTLFSTYKAWGLKGVKFGFVQVGSKYWTKWLHDAVEKAAEYELMVDVHDEYRPTGFSRTYPNLMTQEGIRGNEEMPDATHNTILPFTRFLAGAGDYTIAYYNNRIKTTHAHQLALSVIYYSPIQFIYWYDTPAHYKGEQEIEFFDRVKTVWDETVVIHGEPGKYITIARKSGQDWFLGSITNTEARSIEIPLNFLDQKTDYLLSLYTDNDSIGTRTNVRKDEYVVQSEDRISLELIKSGGAALYIRPASDATTSKRLPAQNQQGN